MQHDEQEFFMFIICTSRNQLKLCHFSDCPMYVTQKYFQNVYILKKYLELELENIYNFSKRVFKIFTKYEVIFFINTIFYKVYVRRIA